MTASDAIRGAIVDVDDTLYPQAQWLRGAWEAVVAAAGRYGADERALREALLRESALGTDRGRLIDRALAAVGRSDIPVPELVAAFRGHHPEHLDLYPGAREALAALAEGLPSGVVLLSDGDPPSQRAKIEALGVGHLVRGIVLSDELGRQYRKPHPMPFQAALDLLGQPAQRVVMIGDRPDKDVGGAGALGIRCVRVTTGEYRDRPAPQAWREAEDFAAAVRLVLEAAGR